MRDAFVAIVPLTVVALPMSAQVDSALPPPFVLTGRTPAQPVWQPVLTLRRAEEEYRSSPEWWKTYTELRAHAEAALGNHADALRYWDLGEEPLNGGRPLPDHLVSTPAVEVVRGVADSVQVIMVNERHHAASDRLLTLSLLPVLRSAGYRYLAAETFSRRDEGLNSRPYPLEEMSGVYVNEPVFGEIVREARRLGFDLIPYEAETPECAFDPTLSRQQCRDYQQARNLVTRIVQIDPEAKILVHVGFAHLRETDSPTWTPMALYFRQMSGINPYTIDQTVLSERSEPRFEHPAYRAARARRLLDDEPRVLMLAGEPYAPADYPVDLQVLTPRTEYIDRRPQWMTLGGRRRPAVFEVPECLDAPCVVELRIAGEPLESVPLDRTEVAARARVTLFVPVSTQAVTVRVLSLDGAVRRVFPVER